MSEVAIAQGSGGPELHCSPHNIYYANPFILRMEVSIDGEPAKINSAGRELWLTGECQQVSLYPIISKMEAVLKSYGVSHVISLWCDDVPYCQVHAFYTGLVSSMWPMVCTYHCYLLTAPKPVIATGDG